MKPASLVFRRAATLYDQLQPGQIVPAADLFQALRNLQRKGRPMERRGPAFEVSVEEWLRNKRRRQA